MCLLVIIFSCTQKLVRDSNEQVEYWIRSRNQKLSELKWTNDDGVAVAKYLLEGGHLNNGEASVSVIKENALKFSN